MSLTGSVRMLKKEDKINDAVIKTCFHEYY